MTNNQIQKLVSSLNGELIETHISWVILTDKFAYKIKKPVDLKFLDFSLLEQRKKFCELEVELNGRLTDIYLSVLAIVRIDDDLYIGSDFGELVDYAVCMKKMPAENRMDVLLSDGKLEEKHIEDLALTIAEFHKSADIIHKEDAPEFIDQRFNNLLLVRDWLGDNLGERALSIVDRSVEFHKQFTHRNTQLFIDRVQGNFKRDLHGDLHLQNIYLNPEPVVFDCIEFDTNYRFIDVLSEVAFICMDLEAHNKFDFSELFLKTYISANEVFTQALDEELFHYYKCYRANVRLKVTSMRAIQIASSDDQIKEIETYLNILENYIEN